MGYVIYLRSYFQRENPSKTALAKQKREVSELAGLLADLEDRFTRFQKREGMRAARSEKDRGEALKTEAAEILAGRGSSSEPVDGKLGLYRRLRGTA